MRVERLVAAAEHGRIIVSSDCAGCASGSWRSMGKFREYGSRAGDNGHTQCAPTKIILRKNKGKSSL